MNQRTIDEYIGEMMRMRARSSLPPTEQFKPKEEPPSVINLGHERPSDLENGTEKEDFSSKETELPPEEAEQVFEPITDMPTEPPLSESDEAREKFDSEEQIEQRIEQDEQYQIQTESPKPQDDKGSGRLIVNVTTGGGLFPVEGASVIVSDTESAGGAEIAAVITDISGKTPVIFLPAPARAMSLTPTEKGNGADARARYAVTVMSSGYVTAIAEGVSVFDGVTSIQKVDMLTKSAADGNDSPRIIEEDTVYRL